MPVKKTLIIPLLGVLLLVRLFSSCIKDPTVLTDESAQLHFSIDTLSFDTVFTTLGSTTRMVKVYNTYNQPLRIDGVGLLHGSSSRFRLNVDGDTSLWVRRVNIAAHDSMFVFVQANINPNLSSEPFLITDSIRFNLNGHSQYLPLTAYGRNAVYHLPTGVLHDNAGGNYPYTVVDCTQWNHTLPHVIFGYAIINEDSVLTLQAGEELRFAQNSGLIVLAGGSLQASGDMSAPILFTSLRHDGRYASLPAQWDYIWLAAGSRNNKLEWSIVENAIAGLRVDTNVNSNPTLRITNSIVRNHSVAGILAQGAHIEADNLLVAHCREADVVLRMGGQYRFTHTTIGGYWNYGTRTSPALIINNWYLASDGSKVLRPISEASFFNSIIYGNYTNSDGLGEVLLDSTPEAAFNTSFANCIIQWGKADTTSMAGQYNQWNINPLFVNPKEGDFHLQTDSPARGMANSTWTTQPYDLSGTPRPTPAAIGCYEMADTSSVSTQSIFPYSAPTIPRAHHLYQWRYHKALPNLTRPQ
ncbi:MAG: hypothetical protein IJV22_05130 [Bacteroidales bacterium]|nr:hypothetical protein [Bacteroidales bacterium]